MSEQEMDPRQVIEAILVKRHHVDLYVTNAVFRSQVDNLVGTVLPAFLDGLAKAAEEGQGFHQTAMTIIKQGIKDAGFRAGGLP